MTYTHWIELEKEGDIGQMCQDIAQLEDDPMLEYALEHNYTVSQDYYDIRFQTFEPLSNSVCRRLENSKGVLNVEFNEEKQYAS